MSELTLKWTISGLTQSQFESNQPIQLLSDAPWQIEDIDLIISEEGEVLVEATATLESTMPQTEIEQFLSEYGTDVQFYVGDRFLTIVSEETVELV